MQEFCRKSKIQSDFMKNSSKFPSFSIKDKLKFLVRNIHQCARLQQSPSCSTFLQDQPGPAATT